MSLGKNCIGMSHRKIFHVGLGKTGSTTLQTVILPYLHDEGVIHNHTEILNKLSKLYYEYKINPNSKSKLVYKQVEHSKSIISFASAENIMGWNPANFESAVSAAKNYLPLDCEIVITLRSPKEWLRSLYLHYVGRSSLCVEPRHFFVNHREMEIYKKYFGDTSDALCISVDDLNYQKIVEIWRQRFKKVHVIPMEALWDGSLLTRLGIEHTQIHKDYIMKKNKTVKNKSFSKESLELTIIRNKILSTSLRFPGHSYGIMAHLEEFYKNHLNYSTLVKKHEEAHLNKSLGRILNKNQLDQNEYFKLLVYHWRNLLRDYEKRLGKINKYQLPENTYLGKHLNDNINFYNDIT